MEYKFKKVCIGIDQSYKRTGITIAGDGIIYKIISLDLSHLECNTLKRKEIRYKILEVIDMALKLSPSVIILTERIRTFSGGFLSTNYIKATGALIATIVDTAYNYDLKTYSVDTRAWKAKVVGTSKGSQGNNKMPTVEYIKKLGFEEDILIQTKKLNKGGFTKNNKNYVYNDDAADSACIALYPFKCNKQERKEKMKLCE